MSIEPPAANGTTMRIGPALSPRTRAGRIAATAAIDLSSRRRVRRRCMVLEGDAISPPFVRVQYDRRNRRGGRLAAQAHRRSKCTRSLLPANLIGLGTAA